MTALLELRENLKKIYSRNEAFITPVIKFLLSFIVLSIINGKMGYMTKLDNFIRSRTAQVLNNNHHYALREMFDASAGYYRSKPRKE